MRKGLIALPPNYSLGATMNTADESIYPMDSAFKRRWTWEYVGIENIGENQVESEDQEGVEEPPEWERIRNTKLCGLHTDGIPWTEVIAAINTFITDNSAGIRGLDDKQIGHWYMKGKKGVDSTYEIQWRDLKPKLLHFLLDSVFSRNRKPLEKKAYPKREGEINAGKVILPTFGAFEKVGDDFMKRVLDLKSEELTQQAVPQVEP